MVIYQERCPIMKHITWIDPPLPNRVWGVIPGDLHLGGVLKNFRIKGLLELLEYPELQQLQFFCFQGDTFERNGVRNLPEYQKEFLSRIHTMAENGGDVCFCRGNHDSKLKRPLKKHYLTQRDKERKYEIEVFQECIVSIQGKRILIMHGHQFDPIVSRVPFTGGLGSAIHNLIGQLEGEEHSMAAYLKKQAKIVLQVAKIVKYQAMEYALLKGMDVIVCGHTHIIDETKSINRDGMEMHYVNAGAFTEKVCGIVTIDWEGNLRAHKIRVHKKSH